MLNYIEPRSLILESSEYQNKPKLNLLAYIIIVELVLGGSGRLLMIGSFLTLRYLLFFLAIIYFVLTIITKKFSIYGNMFYGAVLVFFLLYFMSIVNGLLNGYPKSDIISSSQGYLYLFMIFPFTLFINQLEKVKVVLRIINRCAVILAVLSIVIFLFFLVSTKVYSVVNPILIDLDYGHLAIVNGVPRVFFKTSCYMPIAFIGELFNYVNIRNKRDIRLITKMILLLLGCMTTMTMSIWIALGVGIMLCIFFSKGRKKIFVLITTIIVTAIILLPFADIITKVVNNRFSYNDTSYIIKLNQLHTMMDIWINNFFFGKGFGIKIMFNSEIANREMIKFELFWLELLVCMGITGFISYSYMVGKTLFKGLKVANLTLESYSFQIKAMITGLIMMCVISSVNPFLNNPIGIGYFVIVMSSINAYYKSKKRIITTKLVTT